MLSSVNTQKTTGHLSNKFRSLIPFDVALQIKSKCLVSPLMTLPIAITES